MLDSAVYPTMPWERTRPSPTTDQLRVLTLNVAHGRRHLTHQALLPRHTVARHIGEIGRTLQDLSLDVVALQEADGPSAWSGNFDHVETLAQLSEFPGAFRGDHNPFGFGDRFNLSSGTALLTRRPLIDPVSHRFDASWRDTKGFVAATLTVPQWAGQEIDVVSVHLDFLRRSVRRRQIRHMVATLSGRRRPLVVLGDLNCCWRRDPRTMELLARSLDLRAYRPSALLPTYPANRPRLRIDWILISQELHFEGYQTIPTLLSDHLGVIADLRLR